MATIVYPYDPSGIELTNLVKNELHSVQPPADINQASFIIPLKAPFYNNSLEVWTGNNKTGVRLVEGQDYFLTHEFVAGTNYLGKPLSGGLCFTNALYSGNVYLTYQTLGGDFVVNDVSLLESITKKLYGDVRFVTWDQLIGVPSAFPPDAHQHEVTDIKTLADVANALDLIAASLVGGTGGTSGTGDAATALSLVRQHILSTAAHAPSAVGLGKVANFAVATEQDAVAGSPSHYMTPQISTYLVRRLINEENLTEIRNDIVTLEDAVAQINTGVAQINSVLSGLDQTLSLLNNSINQYRLEVNNLTQSVIDAIDRTDMANTLAMQAMAQAAATEANLMNMAESVNNALYRNTIILPTGTHSLDIPAGTSMRIELIGGGGGSGRWYQTSTEQMLYTGGLSSGEDSVLWFLGTQSVAMEPVPMLVAGGGLAGTNTYGSIGRANSGDGGICRRFRNERVLVSTIKDINLAVDMVEGPTTTRGVAGTMGDTSNTLTNTVGVGGWSLDASGDGYHQTYGRGCRGVTRAGMGGSAGRWFVIVQNDTLETARFIVSVGRRGISARTTANDEITNITDKIVSSGVGLLTIVS